MLHFTMFPATTAILFLATIDKIGHETTHTSKFFLGPTGPVGEGGGGGSGLNFSLTIIQLHSFLRWYITFFKCFDSVKVYFR